MNFPSKAYVQWERDSAWFLPDQYIDKVKKVVLTIYAPNRRRGDLSNKWESVLDLMVKKGLINDDSWWDVPHCEFIFGGVDRKNPRAEVVVHVG